MYTIGDNQEILRRYKPNVRFSEIYGNIKAKEQLGEIIDYFKSNKKGARYKEFGARLKKGVLLYGPPGTGKTMLAKALATEANVSFIYRCASEFIERYVGVGSARVRELFYTAEQMQPCIVFIDELDTLGARTRDHETETNPASYIESSGTINQLLVELDGFKEREDVVVIAATNNVFAIDPAILRSGRFDVRIETKLPDADERAGIIRKKLERAKTAVDRATIERLALEYQNITGADIETIVNEALYIAVRKKFDSLTNQCLIEAFEEFKINQDKYNTQREEMKQHYKDLQTKRIKGLKDEDKPDEPKKEDTTNEEQLTELKEIKEPK